MADSDKSSGEDRQQSPKLGDISSDSGSVVGESASPQEQDGGSSGSADSALPYSDSKRVDSLAAQPEQQSIHAKNKPAKDTVAKDSNGSNAEVIPTSTKKVDPTRTKAGVSWAGRFALLLVLLLTGGLAAGGYWVYPLIEQREAGLRSDIESLRAQVAELPKVEDERKLWQEALADTQARTEAMASSIQTQRQALAQELDSMRASYADQREALRQFDAADQRIWRLAEARYLLRLAHQRLVLGGEPEVALGLLNTVDDSLRELDDPRLSPVRLALAQDREQIRLVAPTDVEGVYHQITALSEQLSGSSFQVQIDQTINPDSQVSEADNLGAIWQALLQKADRYFSVTSIEGESARVSPAQFDLVKQSIRLYLAQAQIALLARDQALYQASLIQASQWLGAIDLSGSGQVSYLQQRLESLQQVSLVANLPNIDRSINALTQYMGLSALESAPDQAGSEE
jgi:uroporphyrin-3 C-methyltransferase